jgi:hypothetical protein
MHFKPIPACDRLEKHSIVLLLVNRKVRLILWSAKTKGTLPHLLLFISHNLNHVNLSVYHLISFACLALGLYFSL